MRSLLSLIFIFIFIGIASATSDMPNIPADVESVTSGGYWQSADQSGCYRIIVVNSGWEHIYSQVFLQWILDGTKEQGPSILFSVPIREINDSPVWSVGSPEFLSKTQQIKLRATNSYTLEEQVFIISPQTGGKYQIK
jgi:hypothetical protein